MKKIYNIQTKFSFNKPERTSFFTITIVLLKLAGYSYYIILKLITVIINYYIEYFGYGLIHNQRDFETEPLTWYSSVTRSDESEDWWAASHFYVATRGAKQPGKWTGKAAWQKGRAKQFA